MNRWCGVLTMMMGFLVGSPCAQATLAEIRHAQARLGPEVWTRLLEIENRRATAEYPKITYALVFEFNSILWFYSPGNGTQSLSTHVGRLESDRGNLEPLLREIHPGFMRFREIAEDGSVPPLDVTLRNGCFIDSLAAARVRAATGETLLRAGLLLYYVKNGTTLHGHAVFAYQTPRGLFVDDVRAERAVRVGDAWTDQAAELVKLHAPELGRRLANARLVTLRPDSSVMTLATAAAARAEKNAGEMQLSSRLPGS